MPYICVRGVDHYYEWVKVEEDTKVKPVMVFIHGWAGSARYWESTAIALSRDFDCLLYDMRGFGRSNGKIPVLSVLEAVEESPASADKAIEELTYELDEYARDLAALLDGLELKKVYLNAHSTGASVATIFLNLYPERVEKAILTCSGVFEYDEKAFAAFHKFGGYVVKFRPKWLAKIPFVDRMFMARFLKRSIPKSDRQAFLDDFLMADYAAAIGTMVTAVSENAAKFMPQEFTNLTVSTLLVAGEYDQIIPPAMGRQAASLSDKVEFVLMPNTAHFPMLEDPITYLKSVRQFLQVA
ncbi:alpha/beta fold hydrolase [Chlorogloea sp. CCALA 695]|uniref:alpha/beta fold hydrolase n=1 Tax=Chlorogloea sp. CCALA 695 TaxID=2107693 RepID=UPI000D064129|nr:alpha/beta hydrolase [Chlorogloea sp. CCALA 695]PSB34245.1 alpha/beta hydrolase [Chlorogloea sp. CCALA 695]